MLINAATPSYNTYARTTLRAAGQDSSAGQGDQVELSKEKPSFMKKVGLSALGIGSIGGGIGWVAGIVTGSASAFPLGVCIGLVAGAAIGTAAYFIEADKK